MENVLQTSSNKAARENTMTSKARNIVEIIHRHNKNTGGNVCTRHFGTRVLRNLRDVEIYGKRERLAEVTIKGEEVHVSVPMYGPAHIISLHSWTHVYGPCNEKAN